jgi:Putative auto-transporter adhesin, head GIN domain
MSTTTAPHHGGRTSHGGQLILLAAATIAALILVAIGIAALSRDGGTTGSGIQGSGIAASQTRAVAKFTGLDLAGSNKVTVVVGAPQSVVVHADTNLLAHVTTTVAGGKLVIANTGSFTTRTSMDVQVSVPSLAALNLSGSGQLSVTGISASRLTVTVSGSGMIDASGTATQLDVALSGSGLARLGQLTASQVHAVVTGSGLIQVTATASLDAAVPGSGAIIYGGDPAQVITSVTGSGTVTRG